MKYYTEVEMARAFTDGMVFEARGDCEFDLNNYKGVTTDCTAIRELLEEAHMLGQNDAGCKEPSYSNAKADCTKLLTRIHV